MLAIRWSVNVLAVVRSLLLRVQGDAEAVGSMLSYGRSILSQVVDENRRRCGRAAVNHCWGPPAEPGLGALQKLAAAVCLGM
jgi:hypothetical protein